LGRWRDNREPSKKSLAAGEEWGKGRRILPKGSLEVSFKALLIEPNRKEEKMRLSPLLFMGVALWGGIGWSQAAEVALVRPAPSSFLSLADLAAEMDTSRVLAEALTAAGISFAELTAEDVALGRLRGHRIVLLPDHVSLSPVALASLKVFVEDGNKIIAFGRLLKPIGELLGVRWVRTLTSAYPGQFASFKFSPANIKGLPETVQQYSAWIEGVEAAGEGQVMAEWVDQEGQATGQPALIASPRGFYLSGVLTDTEPVAKQQLLVALVAHLDPAVWSRALPTAIDRAPRVAGGQDLAALKAILPEAPRHHGRQASAPFFFHRLEASLGLAEVRLRREDYPGAVKAVLEARQGAIMAYTMAQPSRSDELRGVRLHNPYGVADWGWEKTAAVVARSGFNAIFVDGMSGGLACFPSQELPVSKQVEERGNPLWEAIRWCRAYGLELHVVKDNFDLRDAPLDFQVRMKAKSRRQKTATGEELRLLCPSDLNNFQLELKSMIEVVQRYPIAGLHLGNLCYPGDQACFCEGCRERFQRATGVTVAHWPAEVLAGGPHAETFDLWRQQRLTHLLRLVAQKAREVRPGIKISATVIPYPEQARRIGGQDWVTWVEEGDVDFVCPLDFSREAQPLSDLVTNQVERLGDQGPLYVGLAASQQNNVAEVARQIQITREAGADGFVLFNADDLTVTESWLPTLRLSVTSTAARPPHATPKIAFEFPAGLADWPARTYLAETEIPVRITMRPRDTLPQEQRFAQGVIEVRDHWDRTIQTLGDMAHYVLGKKDVTLQLKPGTYHLALKGRMRQESLEYEPFVQRSLPFRVISRREWQVGMQAR